MCWVPVVRSAAGVRVARATGRLRGRRSGIRFDGSIGASSPSFGAPRGRNNNLVLAVGDRVSHDKYGLGKVLETKGAGPTATVTIDFGSAGKVRLMLIGGVPMVKL